jgi:serine phosphatase RsbU (regulator of sigma subunit)
MSGKPKLSLVARLAFSLGGVATLILVGFLLWAGLTAPLNSRMPVPSPDGSFFAYFNPAEPGREAGGHEHDLIISRPQGQLLVRIRTGAGRIIWSNANHLLTVDATTREATLIANAEERFVVFARIRLSPEGEPQWAPDGNKLACLRGLDSGTQLEIYDIQQPRAFAVPLPADFHLNQARLVAWSPGSEHLYILNVEGEESVLRALSVRDGSVKVIARGMPSGVRKLPQISPDGSRIFLPPPQSAIVDAQTGASVWTLPEDAQALWRPWSSDSREFYFFRREDPGEILARNLENSVDRVAVSGVQPNGFFSPEGRRYFYRQPLLPLYSAQGTAGDWRNNSWGWRQADSASPVALELGRIELWPWEQTPEGLILARQDDYTRVRFGLYDPEAHAFDPYTFPTDREDLHREVRSYRLVLATVVIFAFLAGLVLARRSESKAARAYYIVAFLVIALGCGSILGNAIPSQALHSPYGLSPEEIAVLGWWGANALPQLVLDRVMLTLAALWALLPLAALHLGLHFPDGTRFLQRRTWVRHALYGVAALPVIAMILARAWPPVPQSLLRYLLLVAGATVAGVWVLSLGANSRRPPDKRSRAQVRWMIAALVTLGLGAFGILLVRFGEAKAAGAVWRPLLDGVKSALFVLTAWVTPSAIAYAVTARKPSRLGWLLPKLLRQVLTGLPALLVFAVAWAAAGLVLNGSPWAFSAPAIVVAVLLAVIAVLPFRGRLRLAIDRTLDRKRFELRETLGLFARSLPHTIDRETLASQLGETVPKALKARWCLLFAADRGSKTLRLEPGKLSLPAQFRQVTFDKTEPLAELLARDDEPFEPAVASADREMDDVVATAGERLRKLQAEVVLGLRRNELVGLLVMGPKVSGELYDSEELDTLRIVAREAAAALENIEFFQAAARDREMRKEWEDAWDIQAKLLPAQVPRLTSAQLSGCCFPARSTGGDYYDFLKLPARKVGLAMSDVAGKGMAASLRMASVESLLRAQASTTENLAELARKLNAQLFELSQERNICSLFYGVYDDATRRLEYVNAGHNPPLLLTVENAQFLEATGLPLGLFPDVVHQPRSLVLKPGAMLLVYSDGVVNARNGRGDCLGRDRLVSALFRQLESDAERALARVVTEVRDFEGDTLLEDDQTLLLLKVYPE